MKHNKDQLNSELNSQDWPSIDFGIGIHTGPVILGNIGSIEHLDYTIVV